MVCGRLLVQNVAVTSREGRVSRNLISLQQFLSTAVTSREGRVSRNVKLVAEIRHLVGSRPARGV